MAPRVPKRKSRGTNEADATQHAEAALGALLRAPLTATISLDKERITLSDEYSLDDQRLISCSWEGGTTTLRLSVRGGALDVSTDRGAQCVYINFEAYVLGAIQESEPAAPLVAANAYSTRAEDRAAGRDISHYGPLSRRIAARNGLPGEAMGEIGSYVLPAGEWDGGAHGVLERLAKLSIIKAHFLDRGKGEMILGRPIFPIEPPYAKGGGKAKATHSGVPEIPDDLLMSMTQGECVLYTGGLLDEWAGYPSWHDLLEKIVERASPPLSSADAKRLRDMVKQGKYHLVEQALLARLKREGLAKIVHDVHREAHPEPLALYLPLRKIPFAGVLAGGWHDGVARCFDKQNPVRPPIHAAAEFDRLLHAPAFFAIHLYGEPKTPETFLFTYDELRGMLDSNILLGKFLAQTVQSKTLLIFGAYLEDIEQLWTMLPTTRNGSHRKHFALVERTADFDIQSDVFRTKYGVELIALDDGDHQAGVATFLKELQSNLNERLPKGVSARSPALVKNAEIDYINRIHLHNIGPFDSVKIDLSRWNVLLGNNGCGKSTVLRALALCLSGDDPRALGAAGALLRAGEERGKIEVTAGEQVFRTELFRTGRTVRARADVLTPLQTGQWVVLGFPALRGASRANPQGPSGEGSASPEIADVLPLLTGGSDDRLDAIKQWIVNTEVRAPNDPRAKRARDTYFSLLNELMPGLGCSFARVDPDWTVMMRTSDGIVPIDGLSQGTSAIIGWVGTLLMRLFEIHDGAPAPEKEPAIVMIDELDAHMHPAWQHAFAPLFRARFPDVQVIATTHSPLIVGGLNQAEIHHLKRDDEGKIDVLPIQEAFHGWRADQILTGPAFDLESTISREASERLSEYTALAGKSRRTLQEEQKFQELGRHLRGVIPSHPETPAGRDALRLFTEWMEGQLRERSAEHKRRVAEEARRLIAELERPA